MVANEHVLPDRELRFFEYVEKTKENSNDKDVATVTNITTDNDVEVFDDAKPVKQAEVSSNDDTIDELPKSDRITAAKQRMKKSKSEWLTRPINFTQSEHIGKHIACTTMRIGVKHIHKSTPCQDNCRVYSCDKGGPTIVAVADGHGDKSHDLSEFGSNIACDQLCELVKEILDEDNFKNIQYFVSEEFRSKLVRRWEKKVLGVHKREYNEDVSIEVNAKRILTRYGTTLLFAFAYQDCYVVGQLGDGGIMILREDDNESEIHKILSANKVGSGTASLCMGGADKYIEMRIYPAEGIKGIVLMTDGYYDIWGSDENRITASRFFIDKWVKFIKAAGCDEGSEEAVEVAFTAKYNDAVDFATDDISIGILMPNPIKEES